MPVQFEEDRPFSEAGLPPRKPTAMIKFLMNEKIAWSPTAAKIELFIIAIIIFAATIALIVYRDKITKVPEANYDPLNDPMINVVPFKE